MRIIYKNRKTIEKDNKTGRTTDNMNFTPSENNNETVQDFCNSVIGKLRVEERKTSFSSLKDMMTKKRKQLTSAMAHINQSTSPLSDGALWFTENFEHIDKQFISCINELKNKHGFYTVNNLPFEFVCAEKICDITKGNLNESYFDAIVLACDNSLKNGLSYKDMCTFPLLLKCAVLIYLCKCADVICTYSSAIIDCIKTLKALEIYDFKNCFLKCRLEKTLLQDPTDSYGIMTESSKEQLKAAVHLTAKKEGLHDTVFAHRLICKAIERKIYPGSLIDIQQEFKKLYFITLIVLSLVLTSLFCFLSSFAFVFIILLPCFEASRLITDYTFSRISKVSSTVPGIKLKKIPDNAKTLCVITALLRGEKYDSELFTRLERAYNANCEDNIRFGLLCDLPDCNNATSGEDEKLISYASGRIASLNTKYNNSFILFIRPRSYSSGEKCFIPYERKRGAICELTKLLKSDTSCFDPCAPGMEENSEFLKQTKYVITLDADTVLGIETARELVGKMLHPANAAVIDKETNTTVSGYGILQPKISFTLSGAYASPFTRVFCGNGGCDTYSGSSFDIYQSVFNNGIFCGKGIIDTDVFYKTVVNTDYFPEDTVLSHDIIEGEKARCGYVGDIELFDSFPKNELSYLKRKHRWIRGDIQNLIFLSKRIKLSSGYIRNNISKLSKYKIFDNVRRDITPLFSLLCLISALAVRKNTTVLSVCASLPYIVPFFIGIFTIPNASIVKIATRRFFSKGITTSIWQVFFKSIISLSMLAKEAFVCISAVISSIYRLFITKTKLLEWVTAASAEKGYSLYAFISEHLLSAMLGAIIFVFAPSGILKLFGLAFFIMPLLGYLTSKDYFKEKELSLKDKDKLFSYAQDMWQFFEELVNKQENYLPPDNIQFYPYEKTSHKTSPTNIGMYLVSLTAARDFGFIDSKVLYSRTKATLNTVKKLKKWNGHLYNWYNTQTLGVLGNNYVSSVDSGNFIASLIVLKNALSDYAFEVPENLELIPEIDRIINSTDFGSIYNTRRDLFYVGIKNGVTEEGCYDFLMSETRILSYVAIALGKAPKRHWERLSRPLRCLGGYTGACSWSGTAFEYFMPAIFMPAEKGSFIYESLAFAIYAQKTYSDNKVWGISESAYFSFDPENNYEYKAFGVPYLMRKSNREKEYVVSPYSSFLSMCISDVSALENLTEIQKLGAYGKYGFYEAVDFNTKRCKGRFSCVKSYMSHHVGMSLAASANAVFDGIMVRRFMADRFMDRAIELLEEKIPVNAVIDN